MKQKKQNNLLNRKKIFLVSLIVLLLLISVYITFLYSKKCVNEKCFNAALARCNKASFFNTKEEAEWLYVIKGSRASKCIVYVKNTAISIEEAKKIEGKDMLCYIPRGIVIAPESDIDLCHGLLKEELQDLIIEKMHIYIVQNIGKISEEVKRPL